MIKSIQVKNFQAHEETNVELSVGINTIVGLSDSGKSAFIRAVKALFDKDNFYLSCWAESGEVSVEFTDGNIIKRCYSKTALRKCPKCKAEISDEPICAACGNVIGIKMGEDYYEIGTEKYQKFGVKLPDFILEKTRMYPISFLDYEESFNFVNQMDDMFFIGNSYSGGIRNKILSSMIPDSDKVDVLIKKLNSEKGDKMSEFEFFSERLVSVEKIVKESEEDTISLENELKVIEVIESGLVEYNRKISSLETMKTFFEKNKEQTKHLDTIEKTFKNLRVLVEMVNRHETALLVFNRLNTLAISIRKATVTCEPINPSIPSFDAANVLVAKLRRLTEIQENLRLEYTDQEPVVVEIPSFTKLDGLVSGMANLGNHKKNAETLLVQLKRDLTEQKTVNEEMASIRAALCDTLCPIINDTFCDRCKGILGGGK